jgi:hypothetical protein
MAKLKHSKNKHKHKRASAWMDTEEAPLRVMPDDPDEDNIDKPQKQTPLLYTEERVLEIQVCSDSRYARHTPHLHVPCWRNTSCHRRFSYIES